MQQLANLSVDFVVYSWQPLFHPGVKGAMPAPTTNPTLEKAIS
jgi:hypothetical protein